MYNRKRIQILLSTADLSFKLLWTFRIDIYFIKVCLCDKIFIPHDTHWIYFLLAHGRLSQFLVSRKKHFKHRFTYLKDMVSQFLVSRLQWFFMRFTYLLRPFVSKSKCLVNRWKTCRWAIFFQINRVEQQKLNQATPYGTVWFGYWCSARFLANDGC